MRHTATTDQCKLARETAKRIAESDAEYDTKATEKRRKDVVAEIERETA